MNDDGFKPFADDSSVATLDGLSIENGTSSIMMHGDLVIPKDPSSIERVDFLLMTLGRIRSSLLSLDVDTPSSSELVEPDEVVNPFT